MFIREQLQDRKTPDYKWCPMSTYIHTKPENAFKRILNAKKQRKMQLPSLTVSCQAQYRDIFQKLLE